MPAAGAPAPHRGSRLIARSSRAALGIAPGDQAILLCSTFGPSGLIGRYGLNPADQLLTVPGTRVLLTLHPHLWAGRHDHRARLTAALAPRAARGLIICGPDQDWTPFLAAADLTAAVATAAERFDPGTGARLRRDLLAYRGHADQHTKAALYELLGRPLPDPH